MRRTLTVALVLVAALAVGAESEPYSQDTLDLYRLSGLEVQTASVEFQIVDSITIQTQPLAEDVRKTLIESVAEQFASGAVRDASLTRLEERRDPARVKVVLEWLRSPLGRRITKLEEATSTQEGMAALQAYARTLADVPPTPERVAFAERLDAAIHATDHAVDAALRSNFVIAVALNAARPVPDRLGFEHLRSLINAQRDQFRPMVQQVTLVSFLYMYRELSEEDLERYITFYETEAGSWYNDLMSRVMVHSLATLSVRVGEVLGKALDSSGSKRSL